MARSKDDGIRGQHGLCISMRPTNGTLELTLDTVALASPTSRTWRHDVFVTFADLDLAQARRFSFTDEQLANFGRLALGALLGGAA
jgi:hypothetical protein